MIDIYKIKYFKTLLLSEVYKFQFLLFKWKNLYLGSFFERQKFNFLTFNQKV